MIPRPGVVVLVGVALFVAFVLALVVSEAGAPPDDGHADVHAVGWDNPTDAQTFELAPVVTTLPPTQAHETGPTPLSKRTLSAGAMSIYSTGYCETGAMADGQLAHDGAVSSHVLARGSSWRVLDGEFAGRVFIVEDTGPLATFDIAMPGRCADAVAYGRRAIHIEEAA